MTTSPRTVPFEAGKESVEELCRRLGILTPPEVQKLATVQQDYLIDRFHRMGAIGIGAGDTGLGKTPWSVLMGVCVAAGKPFIGRPTKQGTVLYCDGEMGAEDFHETLLSVSKFVGLSEPPPNFLVLSANFSEFDSGSWSGQMNFRIMQAVEWIKPALAIVDALRNFWPEAEAKNDEASKLYNNLRGTTKRTGTGWWLNHHVRKKNLERSVVSLEDDPNMWLQEASGARALITGADTRIGFDLSTQADLVIAGFRRTAGRIEPIHLKRVYDDDGHPIGYRPQTGIESLCDTYRDAFNRLPRAFRFKDAHAAMNGSSGSNTSRFLDQAENAGLVRREGKGYVKVSME